MLVTSPEILVFLFFMITDPRTTPASQPGRRAYAVAVGVLATILIAAAKTEFWAKVAVLGALTIACVAWPLLKRYAPHLTITRRKLAVVGRTRVRAINSSSTLRLSSYGIVGFAKTSFSSGLESIIEAH